MSNVNTGGETAAQRALIALANAQLDLEADFTTIALYRDDRGRFPRTPGANST